MCPHQTTARADNTKSARSVGGIGIADVASDWTASASSASSSQSGEDNVVSDWTADASSASSSQSGAGDVGLGARDCLLLVQHPPVVTLGTGEP